MKITIGSDIRFTVMRTDILGTIESINLNVEDDNFGEVGVKVKWSSYNTFKVNKIIKLPYDCVSAEIMEDKKELIEANRNYFSNRKSIRKNSNDTFNEVILPELKDKYSVNKLNNYQYRISKLNKAVDFYPPSRKVFNLTNKEWTQVFSDNDIMEYIDNLLK